MRDAEENRLADAVLGLKTNKSDPEWSALVEAAPSENAKKSSSAIPSKLDKQDRTKEDIIADTEITDEELEEIKQHVNYTSEYLAVETK